MNNLKKKKVLASTIVDGPTLIACLDGEGVERSRVEGGRVS